MPASYAETSLQVSIAHTAGRNRTRTTANPPTTSRIAAAPTELGDSFPQPNRDLSRSLPSVSHHAGRSQQRAKKRDGISALLPALRRQPLGGGHLGRDGRALRGHLLASHLPHQHLQLPPRLHRAPLPQARLHEVHLLRLRRHRRRRLLLPARLLAGQEDGPRRVQPQGRLAGALLRQAQVRRRRGRRPLRRLRPAQLALRGTRRRQAALRARAARAAHEPPRPARERPHRLRHGLPLLPLLHEHPDKPPEAARLHAAPCGRWGRPRALRHARPQSQLRLLYRYLWWQTRSWSPRKKERKNTLAAQGRKVTRYCNDTHVRVIFPQLASLSSLHP